MLYISIAQGASQFSYSFVPKTPVRPTEPKCTCFALCAA